MWVLLVARRELEGDYNKLVEVLYIFDHKTQYLLIPVPYTHIVVFWNINNMLLRISKSQMWFDTPLFCVASIFMTYCYKTGGSLL